MKKESKNELAKIGKGEQTKALILETALEMLLERERDLKTRLLEIMRVKIATAEPYHQFAGALFKTDADPKSHLNPFSEESKAVREESIALFAETVNGSDARVHKELRWELPYLLWLYHMRLILFWIHDESPKRRRTHRLIEITVDLLVKLIALASNPLMRPLRKATLRILSELREGIPDKPGKAVEG